MLFNDIDVVYFSDEIIVLQSKVSVENIIELFFQLGVQVGVLFEVKVQEKVFEYEFVCFVLNVNWQVKN